ncbi:MAG: MOSC domain-containing protein [Pseudomonadota bacterium]
MLTLAELQARFSGPGRVEAILLRSERNSPMDAVDAALVTEAGLVGDRGRAGKRAVTLLQAEHLPTIAALAGLDRVDAALLRRNILVSGLNLVAFRGRRIRVGTAVLELTVPCHPCSKMEAVLGHGGYTAMRGHGGMCAHVLEPGQVGLGAEVVPF